MVKGRVQTYDVKTKQRTSKEVTFVPKPPEPPEIVIDTDKLKKVMDWAKAQGAPI